MSINPNDDIHNIRFLCFDFEMTGLEPLRDSIIEIGAVPLFGTEFDGEVFFTPVQPMTFVSTQSKKVHGLDGDELWMAPTAEVALSEFIQLAQGRILMGQNPAVDLAFLWYNAKNIGFSPPTDWAIDISKVFSKIFPSHKHLNLSSMAERVGITTRRWKHNALDDALLVAQIFQKVVPTLSRHGIRTLRELRNLASVRRIEDNYV